MRFFKMLAITVSVISLSVSAAFAAPGSPDALLKNQVEKHDNTLKERNGDHNTKHPGKKPDIVQDTRSPIERLQSKKEEVQSMLKEGKISQEKADAITSKIDARIKEFQEFEKLSVPQKKEKLINKVKAFTDKMVSENKITREKADEMVKNYTEKIQKWDGNGYPDFFKRGFKHKRH